MSFDEFVKRIKKELNEYLPDYLQNMKIIVKKYKSHGEECVSLSLKDDKQNSSQPVNLEDYYWDFCHGRSFHNIMGAIAETLEMKPIREEFNLFSDFQSVRNMLFIKVCDVEKNQERLGNMPHTVIEDLAITYHIKYQRRDGDTAFFDVTNEIQKVLNVSKEELHRNAIENSTKMFPAHIYNLADRIRLQKEFEMKFQGKSEAEIEKTLEEYPTSEENLLTVVTNNVDIDGAAAIFYPDMMDTIAQMMEMDYFIIPSTLHEMLVLPDNGAFTAEELKETLVQINTQNVAPWDRLNDQIYHYDPIDKIFEKAEVFEKRVAEKTENERVVKRTSVIEKLNKQKEATKTIEGVNNHVKRQTEMNL